MCRVFFDASVENAAMPQSMPSSLPPNQTLLPKSLAPIVEREFGLDVRIGGKRGRMQQERLASEVAAALPRRPVSGARRHAAPVPPKRTCHSAICSSVIFANSTSGGLIGWPAFELIQKLRHRLARATE